MTSLFETSSLLPATLIDEMLAAEWSGCGFLTMTISDFSGFSWSPLCKNQNLAADEQEPSSA